MREIKAIIQPFLLDKVLDALHEIPGLPGHTVSEVQGCGCTQGKESEEGALEATKKIKIEIVASNKMSEEIIKTIQKKAKTGNRGDGKIFIYDVLDALAIRTNKRGEPAI